MKLIVALIQPYRLEDVKKALVEAKVTKRTVTPAQGCGKQAGFTEEYRGAITEINLLKKIRLDIAVNDDYVDITIDAIIKGARTGKIGDGKIWVMPLEQCIRIRTGERGSEAIG